jgi:DNA-binding PadR family transcriptional regulator
VRCEFAFVSSNRASGPNLEFPLLISNTQRLYVASDIGRDNFRCIGLVSSLLGKTVGVPRGLLKFLVLQMLSEKPRSGAEIVELIEKQTAGRWKPSPGSIYPLLAWMLDKGLTKESPKEEGGFKRYSFTAQGSEYLEKQIQLGKDFLNRMEFLLPMLVGGVQLRSGRDKLRAAIEPALQLTSAFMWVRHNVDGLSQNDVEEIAQALSDCARKLERFSQRPKNDEETKFG